MYDELLPFAAQWPEVPEVDLLDAEAAGLELNVDLVEAERRVLPGRERVRFLPEGWEVDWIVERELASAERVLLGIGGRLLSARRHLTDCRDEEKSDDG